jgi:hypothetical protein
LLAGGFGSYLLEMGLNVVPIYLKSSVCGEVGQRDFLLERHGLGKENIVKQMMELN